MGNKIIQIPHGFCNVATYDEYAPTITTSCWECNNFLIEDMNAKKVANINPSQQGINGNVYSDKGLSPTLTTNKGEGVKMLRNFRIRKLTPRECFRLMGVADQDIDTIQASGISNAQQYKMAGNSIVVDVLTEIFRKAFIEQENENQQLTLF